MKKLLLIPLMILALITSCKKEKLEQITGSNSNAINKSMKVSNPPKVKDNILFFDSEEHLQSYYLSLDEIIEKEYEDSLDIDSLLKEVEDGLNFLSFRQDFINKYDWEGKEFTAEEIDKMYEKDFIIDEIRKSILNEYLEVGIGEYVYVYYSENQIYKIPYKKFDKVIEFRNAEKGNDDYIPFDLINFEVELLSHQILLSKESINKDLTGEFFYQQTTFEDIECNTFSKTVTTKLLRRYFDSTSNSTVVDDPYTAHSMTIDFGDGTNSIVLNNHTASFTHEYPSLGSFDIVVTSRFYNSDGNLETIVDTETLTVGLSCTDANFSQHDNVNDSDWKLSYKLWVKHDLFGKHIGAHTHSWKWKTSKSKWKRKKANLFCRVEGKFGHDNCVILEDLARSKVKYGKKLNSKKHKAFKNYSISNGDCKSAHSFGGGSWYNTLVLNPCQ